jgi:hypothetical protein
MRTLFVGLLLCLLAACNTTNRPENPALAVKTGSWDVTSGFNEKESVDIPQSVIDRMMPEQRADYERIMRESAKQPKTRTVRVCVTAEDLKSTVFTPLLWLAGGKCNLKVTSATAQHREAELECNGGGGRTYIRYLVFDAPSAESVRGKVSTRQEVTRIVADMNGEWVGATCDVPTKH